MQLAMTVLPGIGNVGGTFEAVNIRMGERTPDLVVYRNPSEEQLRSMLGQATLNSVRWLRAPDDEVYVWPAWAATHDFMRQSLGYDKAADSGVIVLKPDG